MPLVGATDTSWNRIPVKLARAAPNHGPRLRRNLDIVGSCPKQEDEVVVQVIGILALGRDAVNVDTSKGSGAIHLQTDAGFFDDLAPRRRQDSGVFRFHVAARQQPTIEAAVVNALLCVPPWLYASYDRAALPE